MEYRSYCFFLIFPAASLGKNPLLMTVTTCGQQRQCIGNLLIQLLIGTIAAIDLMKHLAILDKQHTAGVAGRLHRMRYHQNRLPFAVDFMKIRSKSSVDLESRAPVGSSASTNLGLVIKARATAALCF